VLSNLELLLRVKDVPGTIMLALPLAYALGSLLNFFLIWVLFKKDFLHGSSSKLWITFIQSATGAVVMGLVAYISLGIFDDVFSLSTGRGVFLQGLISGIIGISVGVFVLMILKNQELEDLMTALGHKFWRGRVIAPEQREL
jgi:peptidoglycan biosynthesis protein MviN/MurJ (putative lipid II flippase)